METLFAIVITFVLTADIIIYACAEPLSKAVKKWFS